LDQEQPTNILLVDDCSIVRCVVGSVLTQAAGIGEVRTARDALEAAEILSDWHPDVLVLDVQMPGMDGLEFLQVMRNLSPVPTVILSATQWDSDRLAQVLDGGAVSVVSKPDLRDPAGFRTMREALLQEIRAAAHTEAEKPKPG
jgi:two-component system, chemotaxis family, protein-glutamate methylesterase/glutaminase